MSEDISKDDTLQRDIDYLEKDDIDMGSIPKSTNTILNKKIEKEKDSKKKIEILLKELDNVFKDL